MGRAPCCEKVGLKRGRWTADEDEILIKYIQKNGEGSWRSLPKNAGLLRCGKSCRLRWINYLRADLKRGNFSIEEEETIINLHRSVGNKWSLIASHLPGRTDNEVKNYWNSHLRRKIYSFRSSNVSLMTSVDMVKLANTCKRRGGRVSKSVAKKYRIRSGIKTSGPKPESDAPNGTEEFTATENAKARNARVGLNDASSGMQEFPEGEKGKSDKTTVGLAQEIICGKDLEMEFADIFDEIERGSTNNLHGSCSEGLEVFPGTNFGTPIKLEGNFEVLGPYEEHNDATLVDQIKEISKKNEETKNGTMAPEGTMINQDGVSSEAWNSNLDTGKLDECFSPLNSCFVDELAKWDLDAAALDFGLWDEGHDFLLWV